MSHAPQIIIPLAMREEAARRANRIEIQPEDDVELALAKTEIWIAANLGQELAKWYPGREWRVECDARNGIVIIQCPDVSAISGYHLSLSRTLKDLVGQMKRVGGEILERAKLSRDPIASTKVIDEIEAAPRNVRDEIKGLDHGKTGG